MEITVQKSNQLKALAILMMLCLHLFNQDYHGLFTPIIFIGAHPLSYYISLFCDACVPIFCFVSGYGLYFNLKKDSVKYNQGNLKRILKLLINYWIVLLVFVLIIGSIMKDPNRPGDLFKFILNFTGLSSSYNGAWWFFFTYILLVSASSVLFRLIERFWPSTILITCLFIYLPSFYFRVYKPDIFHHFLLDWLQQQLCLLGTSLLPFAAGGVALKSKWNTRVSHFFQHIKYKNLLAILFITLLVIVHGLLPNFLIAPFLAIPFIFIFNQINLPKIIDKCLTQLAPHATNMWLTHMFFYAVYFTTFIYSFKFVPLIFLILVLCTILSSLLINVIYKFILNKISL